MYWACVQSSGVSFAVPGLLWYPGGLFWCHGGCFGVFGAGFRVLGLVLAFWDLLWCLGASFGVPWPALVLELISVTRRA